MKVERVSVEELKKIYALQCGACVSDPGSCGGDVDGAKAWRCGRFVNGLVLVKT